MHTTSFAGTTFTYNSDYSGPLIIVSKNHSIETTVEAIEKFIQYKQWQEKIQQLEKESDESL
jgi:hypothetical protein